ncbi:MAG TPA: hypothetical protein VGO11_19085 [Chthoniobacteraceae bacterium]|jgi:hypothetical protein|nr:hypothetical protein [Chthoniobacteraceae bacterium]
MSTLDLTPFPDAPTELLRELQRLVQSNTRRWKLLIVLEMLAVTVAAPLAYLWVVFSLDILVHLPRWGRVATSALFFAVLVVLGRWIWRRWKEVRLTEDQVALAIERQTPGTSNQIINSLQISRGGGENSAAVLRENHASLQRIHLRQAAKWRPALIRLAVAGVVLVIGVCFYFFKQDHFANAASRLFQPFAEIAPLYRTTLLVEPGNIQAEPGSTVKIHVRISGERPAKLAVQQSVGDTHASDHIAVPAGADYVEYTFRNLQRSLTYTVSGGDYTSPLFNIEVPLPPQVNLVRATMHLPEYTRLPAQKVEAHGGDLEALQGTRAEVRFVLDQPADQATLLLEAAAEKGAPATAAPRQVALKRITPTEFSGEIVFKDVTGYQVRVQRGQQAPGPSLRYGLRILPDEPPQLTLTGLDRQMEAQLGVELPLKIGASDDYGVATVGLFARKITSSTKTKSPEEGWQPVTEWPQPNFGREVKLEHKLAITALGAVEGEKMEVALRARDADPAKANTWTTGESFTLIIGGEGTMFQVIYEQILQSEADLKKIIARQQEGVTHAAEWIQKFDPASGLRWDDQKTLDALAAAMKEQAKAQEDLRQTTGAVARDLVSAAGNLRLSLGMLADTEMVRSIRVLEGVAVKETPPAKRAALEEVRFTQERTIRSLSEILEQYVQFRQNWELANMTPFVKMLADRQAGLRDESAGYVDKGAQPAVAQSAGRRQAKLLALSGLAQTALAGVGERTTKVDPLLGTAFSAASTAFDSAGIKAAMQQAVAELPPGHWTAAVPAQTKAAVALLEMHTQLKKAAAEAMARAMKDAELKASQLAAQKELGKLMAGSEKETEKFMQDLGNISQVVQMREALDNKRNGGKDKEGTPLPAVSQELADAMKTGADKRPDLSSMFLGNRIEETKKMSEMGGIRPNEMVAPLITDKIDDLVGKLLEEADEMNEQFESLTANSGLISADPGEVGKLAGRMNSSGATSTTGNKKPPTTNVGGMSATGRQGARSYGKVAGSESQNMRGRDKVQEGQFAVPDQAGVLQEKKTADMQPDTSTGIGGKRVESEKTKFSTSDKGEWDDKMADRMQKPQAVTTIVERQGKPLDPRVAALLRDADGTQKQLIERANALRKELKNLYLPTDHLDDLVAQLNQNLEKLRENPAPETFRTQVELLDRLRSEARVFNRAATAFQPSLPRNQQVRGRILDEPASPPMPGYENAVKEYYRRLAAP